MQNKQIIKDHISTFWSLIVYDSGRASNFSSCDENLLGNDLQPLGAQPVCESSVTQSAKVAS